MGADAAVRARGRMAVPPVRNGDVQHGTDERMALTNPRFNAMVGLRLLPRGHLASREPSTAPAALCTPVPAHCLGAAGNSSEVNGMFKASLASSIERGSWSRATHIPSHPAARLPAAAKMRRALAAVGARLVSASETLGSNPWARRAVYTTAAVAGAVTVGAGTVVVAGFEEVPYGDGRWRWMPPAWLPFWKDEFDMSQRTGESLAEGFPDLNDHFIEKVGSFTAARLAPGVAAAAQPSRGMRAKPSRWPLAACSRACCSPARLMAHKRIFSYPAHPAAIAPK